MIWRKNSLHFPWWWWQNITIIQRGKKIYVGVLGQKISKQPKAIPYLYKGHTSLWSDQTRNYQWSKIPFYESLCLPVPICCPTCNNTVCVRARHLEFFFLYYAVNLISKVVLLMYICIFSCIEKKITFQIKTLSVETNY